MQTRNITYKGSEIFYKVIGSGSPVVLIHGFGEDSKIWENLITALQDTYRLIVPDLPGSGPSTYVKGADIDTYAEIVHQILGKEDTGNVVMIGHSMGGYITLAFAEKYADRLTAFGLFHSSAFADDAAKKEARQKGIDSVKSDGVLPFMKKNIQGLFTESFAKDNQPLIDSLVNNVKGISAETVIQYYEAMMKRPDRINILESFLKPILFIIGTHDKAIPIELSMKQCYLPKISYVHIMENSAHMSMLEEKEKSTSAVVDFLTDTLNNINDV